MEQSHTYQTTVDTDTFHPRDPHDPEDVAQVIRYRDPSNSARMEPNPIPQMSQKTLSPLALKITVCFHCDAQVAVGGEGLPAPDPSSVGGGGGGDKVPVLDMSSGGGSVSMDAMGPVVGAHTSTRVHSPF